MIITFIEKILVVSVVFSSVSILLYINKTERRKKEAIALKKLHDDARCYFVTICYKTLTPFMEGGPRSYKTFSIDGTRLYVYKKTPVYQSPPITKKLMSIRFDGDVLIDELTKKEYSCSGFETYLLLFLGNSLVYDQKIALQWQELQEKEK